MDNNTNNTAKAFLRVGVAASLPHQSGLVRTVVRHTKAFDANSSSGIVCEGDSKCTSNDLRALSCDVKAMAVANGSVFGDAKGAGNRKRSRLSNHFCIPLGDCDRSGAGNG